MSLTQSSIEDFVYRESLRTLIKALRKVFKANAQAKDCLTYWGRMKAYERKDEFLSEALEIASHVINEYFKYGLKKDNYAEDTGDPYKYIYYFQILEYQVSFHSHRLYEEVPLFNGDWIGHRNQSFPFDLRKLKKYVD